MRNVFLGIIVILIFGCSKDSVATPTIITDRDGNVYNTLIIGNQTWMTSNLNVPKYQDGTLIPEEKDPAKWATLTTGAWRYYDNDPKNAKLYGKLYIWYAVNNNNNNNKGLAPAGYQIPADEQWTTLTNFIGSEAGLKMKETDTSNWTSPNSEATNSTGFTGLPGGICISNGDIILLVIMATGGVQPVWTQQRPGIEV